MNNKTFQQKNTPKAHQEQKYPPKKQNSTPASNIRTENEKITLIT